MHKHMQSHMHLITPDNPYIPPEIGSRVNGGLSFVEFHRIANRVLDTLDPKLGKGQLYTEEEIARSCKAREILAEELYILMSGNQKAIDQAIELERTQAREANRLPKRTFGRLPKEPKPTPTPKPTQAMQRMARMEAKASREASRLLNGPVQPPKPVKLSEFDPSAFARDTEEEDQTQTPGMPELVN